MGEVPIWSADVVSAGDLAACGDRTVTSDSDPQHGQRAIDDQTAIRVPDGAVDVISEGHWKLFNG